MLNKPLYKNEDAKLKKAAYILFLCKSVLSKLGYPAEEFPQQVDEKKSPNLISFQTE